jgi:hypothetical protein
MPYESRSSATDPPGTCRCHGSLGRTDPVSLGNIAVRCLGHTDAARVTPAGGNPAKRCLDQHLSRTPWRSAIPAGSGARQSADRRIVGGVLPVLSGRACASHALAEPVWPRRGRGCVGWTSAVLGRGLFGGRQARRGRRYVHHRPKCVGGCAAYRLSVGSYLAAGGTDTDGRNRLALLYANKGPTNWTSGKVFDEIRHQATTPCSTAIS